MALDTSIYQNIKPIAQVEQPSFADSMQKGMNLANMHREMQTQQAMRDSYANNTGADGKLNRQAYLSDLGKVNPQAAMQYQRQFSEMDKQDADSQLAKMQAAHQVLSVTQPAMEYLAGMPEDKRAENYHSVMKSLAAQGVPTQNIPKDSQGNFLYDPGQFKQAYSVGRQTKEALDNQLAQANIGKTQAESDKLRSETYKRNPDIAGQTNDPAKLVPNLVPKEHQAKAFSEIDAAENTRKMSKSIMDSFEAAAKDTSGVGAVTSPFRSPRSSLALHQAMQPTFKDLEGTVRQAAMDNTFNNITPSATDSAKDIQTKRAALQDYLQSKLSAPTARAYGIDLGKFDSTSPYRGSPKASPQSADPGAAYAAPAPKGMIRMAGPDGKIRLIPLAQKGEAIAAGGEVIK